MGKRYTKTERLGINKTENFFLEEFDWIFRDQPLVDVGVDAIVEIQENGNPTGQFLALQIKAGKSHLKHPKKEPSNYVYYTSNIHYNYWLKLNIPMLFVVYLPSKKKLYWQYILDENFEETSKNWKLRIPTNQVLGLKDKEEIQKFVFQYKRKIINIFSTNLKPANISDYKYGIEYINEATEATLNQQKSLEIFNSKIRIIVDNINEVQNFSDKKSLVKLAGTLFNSAASRIQNETFIFSDNIAEGIYSFQMQIKIALDTNQEVNLSELCDSCTININSIDFARQKMKKLRKSILDLPDKMHGVFIKQSKANLSEAVSSMILELKNAQELWQNLHSFLTKKLNSQSL